MQFFCCQIISNVSYMYANRLSRKSRNTDDYVSLGPVAQYHENSKYYSAIRPAPNKTVDTHLPHITIQMPVYKESLTETM